MSHPDRRQRMTAALLPDLMYRTPCACGIAFPGHEHLAAAGLLHPRVSGRRSTLRRQLFSIGSALLRSHSATISTVKYKGARVQRGAGMHRASIRLPADSSPYEFLSEPGLQLFTHCVETVVMARLRRKTALRAVACIQLCARLPEVDE